MSHTAVSQECIKRDGFDVQVLRSAKRQTMALEFKQGAVAVRMPAQLPLPHAERFVDQKTPWIQRQLQRWSSSQTEQVSGDHRTIWLYGQTLRVEHLSHPAFALQMVRQAAQLTLCSPAPLSSVAQRNHLQAWIREQAEHYLPERASMLANRTQLHPRRVCVRSYRARWGCCRSDGEIRLNWQLVMAPPDVIDYVIIHELCHLRAMNHSQAFWQLVHAHCPDFAAHRQHLKRWGFRYQLQ